MRIHTVFKPLHNAVAKAGAKIGSKAAAATVAQKVTVGVVTVATAGAIGGGAYLSTHKPSVESKQPAKPAIEQKVEEKKPENKVEETKTEETKPDETKPDETTTTDDPSPAAHDHITPDTPAPEQRGGGSTEEPSQPSQPSEPASHWGIVKYGTPAHVETRHLGTRYFLNVYNPDGVQQGTVTYGADARYASRAAAQAGETAKYGAGTTFMDSGSEEVTEPYDVPATPDEYGLIYD